VLWVYFWEGASEETATLLVVCFMVEGMVEVLRWVGNVLAIRTVGDEDWKFAILGRDWAVHITTNGQITVLERHGNVLLEYETIFQVFMDLAQVSDLDGHYDDWFQSQNERSMRVSMVQCFAKIF
jgi:hypothetical protein